MKLKDLGYWLLVLVLGGTIGVVGGYILMWIAWVLESETM